LTNQNANKPTSNFRFLYSSFQDWEKRNTRNGTNNFPNVSTHVIQGQVHDQKSFYSVNGLSGHAGLFTNLNDMAILTQIMWNNGIFENIKFVNKNVQDLLLTPYVLDPSYGLGWRLNLNKSLFFFGLNAYEEGYDRTG
jgi:CubicO group peptidase (beta-lactamase class C family)